MKEKKEMKLKCNRCGVKTTIEFTSAKALQECIDEGARGLCCPNCRFRLEKV